MNNLNLIVRMDIILNNSCTDYLISYEVVRDSYFVYVSSTVLTQNNVITYNRQMGRKCTPVYDGKSCTSG